MEQKKSWVKPFIAGAVSALAVVWASNNPEKLKEGWEFVYGKGKQFASFLKNKFNKNKSDDNDNSVSEENSK